MIRLHRLVCRTLAALAFATVTASADSGGQRMTVEKGPFPAPPFDPAGGFLSQIGGTFVAGAPGSAKTAIWTSDGGAWADTGLSVPVAAAAIPDASSVILVGGFDNGAATPRVSRLTLEGGKPVLTPLPNLPFPVGGAAGAVIGRKAYVFGGAASPDGRNASKALWVLDLDNPTAWTGGAPFPGDPRSFMGATGQYGMLCLFGGLSATGAPLSETWVFRPSPLEGTKESGWRRMADLPSAAANLSALPLGQAQVLVTGLTGGPFLFHTITDAWSPIALSSPLSDIVPVSGTGSVPALGRDSGGTFVGVSLRSESIIRTLGWIDYGVIILYFVILAWIGFSFSKQESSEEFSLGNRKVKWWAAGLSMFATGASAISFMAIPALAFSTNLVWLFPLIAFIPGYFVTAYFIFPMLRRLEITSTYEYLERRFNRPLRLISSAQSILFQTFARTSVVLVLPALAISAVTGIDVYLSVLVMGLLTTIYTAVGGFEAVIWTEVFQAVLMLLAPIAIIAVCIFSLPGGAGEFVQIGNANGKFDFALLTWDVTVPAVWILIVMQFLTCTVATAGDQPVIQRVFSAPLAEVRKVNAMSTVCGIVIGILVNVMGLAIFAYFHAHPQQFDPVAQNDQVVPMFVAQAMPIGMAGMIIAAIFAASMSTVASIMNSVATLFTEDFYMRFRKSATDRERLLTLKTGSYVVGVIGTVMALLLAAQDIKSMMVVWSQLSALLGGGIVGVYSLGMFTKRANGFGAICGAITSMILTVLIKAYTPLHWGTYLPIAIISCIVFGYLFSLLRPGTKNIEGLTVFTPAKRPQ